MLVMKSTHEAAIRQLQAQLAGAQQAMAHHAQAAARNAQTANDQQQEAQRLAAELAAEKQAHEKTQGALLAVQKQQAILATNLAQLAGPSVFIHLGKERLLFTQIQRITVNDRGEVEKVNDSITMWETLLAEDLERLVSAFYKRAQQGSQE